MNENKITSLMERALNLLKESTTLSEEAIELTKVSVNESASEEDKEKLFKLQSSIDAAIKSGDLEAVKNLQKEWSKTSN